ncbi:espin isoform X1 [Anabrus simplex]|uniref:espin isoform X1 n=1 Tax=Anabrus simplex TaxID=316456 RepID=UPI0035A3AF8D
MFMRRHTIVSRYDHHHSRSANSQMDNDVTPVYLAAQEGHLDVLKYLVTEAGGSLYVRAKDGMAPVHAASQMGCLACLKWMILEQGVDPNLRDGDGATPLHFAASRGHVETVRWLLRHGARLAVDKFGKSAINDAAENQQMECLSLLVQHGTTPDYNDSRNKINHTKSEPPSRCSHGDCGPGGVEPFYLHPPSGVQAPSTPSPPSPPQQDGLYINPMAHGPRSSSSTSSNTSTTSSNHSDPFYLHNPRELIYNRVKDLFEAPGVNGSVTPSPPPPAPLPPPGLTVKVEVHSSSSGAGSGSDENLSSSDLSERSGDVEHDHEHDREPDPEPEYEDIYLLRDEATHSPAQPGHDQPSMTASTESGVSSASPSDLGHSEEEAEKLKVPSHHTLPSPHNNNNNSRALKRVVSEPGGAGPPPPPPPPPVEEEPSPSAPPSPAHLSRRASTNGEDAAPLQAPPSPVVNPEPVVKPSEVLKALGARKQSVDSSSGSQEVDQDGGKCGGPNLVNKQMVLPFVPPKFPSNAADSNSLIKPSEYLRSLGGIKTPAPVFNPVINTNNNNTTVNSNSSTVSTGCGVKQEESSEEPTVDTKTPTSPAAPSVPVPPAPVGPPPPPLPSSTATLPSPTTQQTLTEAEKAKQLQQPLGAISIQDLNSVQLRRTDKMLAAKTLSAPPRSATLHNGEAPFQTQKEDLIAELKMARDVPGIKKLKVERAKVEEKQEKELLSEISRSLTANSFVEKIPDKDATGNPIPEWKRQMLAKKAAERARKELEQQMIREAEEKRLQSIPAWKRQLLAKKEDETKKTGVYTPRVVEDKRPTKSLTNKDECWHQQQQQQPAAMESNPATSTPKEDSSNKENKTPAPSQTEEETAQIMPWRAQLRKTNSKLSLME